MNHSVTLQAQSNKSLGERLSGHHAPLLDPIYSDLSDEILVYAGDRAEASPAQFHCELVLQYCLKQRDQIVALQKAESVFQSRFTSAADEAEERAAILEFARSMGADTRQLRRDKSAFRRFFDADAIIERFHKRVGERDRALAYALERLGNIAGDALREDPEAVQRPFFADSLNDLLGEMRVWSGDSRTRRAAHICLMHAVGGLAEGSEAFWLDMVLSATRRSALDETEDAWTQCAALDALLAISPQSVPSAIMRRISVRAATLAPQMRDNELFVRRHMVRMVCRQIALEPKFSPLMVQLANDSEGAVRQAFADCLHLLPRENAAALLTRLRTDRDPQVRAAIFADPARICTTIAAEDYAHHILRVLAFDQDEFVLRIALDASCELVRNRIEADAEAVLELIASLRAGIAGLYTRDLSPKVLRWAGEARERLWLYSDEEAQTLAGILHAKAGSLREAQTCSISALRDELKCNPEKVGRVMAVLAQNDFALTIRPGLFPRIQRGEYFRPRFWRILFEGRNSATDKRQAFRHTIGRHSYGSMIAPSARMAELAPTKVPGEPLFESKEGGWRNYLPLLDQILSALDQGGETQFFTSEGITRITPPSSFFRRAWLFIRISRDFSALANLRNREPAEFVRTLRGMGIECDFESYEDVTAESSQNPHVTKLYGFGGAALALPVLWDRALTYFSTVYENSLVELALFIALAWVWFFGRHMVLGWRARRLRNGLSLVLGGWGTRGKSGTERLKAGLVNALGPTIVSKTTGCEAMFLLGNSYGELTEMFLFRPYDKATIWEQFNLLKTSRGLKARVFLWECMGLNPSYVRVLQQDWMRDDIGTITNTYPDHEDVQGPAGRNIPEVMCEFIPHNSLLLMTEEEMLPILAQGAERAGSRMRAVNWKQAGLIHKSLLDRFPYEEHPYNIALVAAMGDELGLEPDFCIKEMSDRVVADLGVLKTYPRSEINGRTLEFVMGMSANERFGAMGNWARMGFSEHSLARDPEIFVTTVVNNRADRVPRSRVFARMLVRDIAADRHFLIGSNIEGLLGFIEEEWSLYAAELTLYDEKEPPAQRLEALARQQRIAITEAELDGRLKAMLAPQAGSLILDQIVTAAHAGDLRQALNAVGAEQVEGICRHYDELAALHRDFAALAGEMRNGGDQGAIDTRMRQLMGRAFHAKLVPVRDFYIRGEELVRFVAEQVPPGLISRIMGMQNIKGTGLDWVYRWQAWEAAAKACDQLRQDDPALAERGFRTLASFQEFGALSEAEVRAAISGLREKIESIPTISLAQVDTLEARLEAQLSKFASNPDLVGKHEPNEGWLSKAGGRTLSLFEAFIDAGDAVRRRKASDRIYKAMIAEQISNQRAASELKKLTTRQKGGWLVNSLKLRFGRLSQSG